MSVLPDEHLLTISYLFTLNTNNSHERREHLRRSVVSNVQIDHEILGKTVGASVNISDSGMLLLVDALIQRAFPVEAKMKISLLDSINPEIAFSARVVRNNHHGIAVQLTGYEFRGDYYSLSELRRQWFMSRPDLNA